MAADLIEGLRSRLVTPGLGVSPITPWFMRETPRVEHPIRLYMGRRRQGKTLCAVQDVLLRQREGRRVLSNILVRDAETGQECERIKSWADIYDPETQLFVEQTTVLIDEAAVWCGSRFWSKIPGWLLTAWQQCGHSGTDFVFTSHDWASVDKSLRLILDEVVICKMYRGPAVPTGLPLVRQHILYPDDFNAEGGAIQQAKRSELVVVWKMIPAWVFSSYDTAEAVRVYEWGLDDA